MSTSIQLERDGRVVILRLDEPKTLNALNTRLMQEVVEALTPLDSDPEVGCMVLTGSEKAFAAGADIAEMCDKSSVEMFHANFFSGWDAFYALRTPKIAAVSGYALGGGCELAMMCDMIYAADTAQFGQPEIKLGVIPGMGGSQRLTGLVGKAKAMDLILTGRMMDAVEAERAGLVARVFPADQLLEETTKAAKKIAGFGKMATMAARETVNHALESNLQAGLLFEKRVFHSLFATADQKEGMQAFLEKRAPKFEGK